MVAPTMLEYWAARVILRGERIRRCGIGARTWNPSTSNGRVVLCGLAGGVAPNLSTGDVFIPDRVALENGTQYQCEPDLVEAMRSAARSFGFHSHSGLLLTASSLVSSETAGHPPDQHYAAVDMETGLLASQGISVATVRVILDTPTRPISGAWVHSPRAALTPSLWPELAWMSRHAPLCSLRAAQVVRKGLAIMRSRGQTR